MDVSRSSYVIVKYLFKTTETVVSLLLLVVWILGFVIAKGFWSTLFCFIPFYSYYIVAEHYWKIYGG